MQDPSIQRSDQDALSSVLRRKTLPPPAALPRPAVDAATVRSDSAHAFFCTGNSDTLFELSFAK